MNLPNNNAKRDTQNAPVPYGTGQAKRIGIKLFSILFALFALFTIHYSLFTFPVHAQAKFDTSLEQFQKALNGNQYNKETFDLQSVAGISGSLYTMLVGCSSSGCPTELKVGAVFKVGELIASIYTIPPASGIYYAMDIGKKLSPLKPVYAEETGVGFRALEPFLAVWKAVRNMVYILFVLGAVILGLLVMFRTKISPQAVMTVQSALPGLVIGLVMVTFSYAIVGFLIDLTYVAVGALMWGMGAGNLIAGYDARKYFTDYANADFTQTTMTILNKGFGGAWDILRGAISNPGIAVGAGLGTGFLAVIAAVAASSGFGAPLLGAVGISLVPLLLGLAIAFIAFLIKVLFTLAKAYLLLLIYLILSPIFILWAVLSRQGFWDAWLKPTLANLLVFPAVGIIVFLANVLIAQIDNATGVWGPPYLGQQHVILKGIIGLGAIILLPQMPEIINQMLNVKAQRAEFPGASRQLQDAFTSIAREFQRLRPPKPTAGTGSGTAG